jgi:predicted esterase
MRKACTLSVPEVDSIYKEYSPIKSPAMRKASLTCLVLLLLSVASSAAPGTDLIKDLILGDVLTSARAVEALAAEAPESLATWIQSFDDFPPADTTGWAFELKHPINDTLTAPAWLFVPTGYNPKEPTALVVALHGGVSGAKFRDGSTKNWLDDEYFQLAEQENWLMLYPMGMMGCAWWDRIGMENILWFIREVKRRYNVDDDRVAMCGFSDGASGSYHFAMLAPTDFAVFYPWSGVPSVGTQVGGIQTYLGNLQNRPLFATNGGKDQLYPAKDVEPYHRLALIIGGRVSAAYYDTAGHNGGYMPPEWAMMSERFDRHNRDPFPPGIYFETADLEFARSDWITILALDTGATPADWRVDSNLKETDDRLTIGFNPDPEYKGKGIKIGYVSPDPEAPATKAGLKVGDILLQIDDVKLSGMAEITKAKTGRKRGDPIKLIFKRGSKKLEFETSYPPVREYDAFPRTLPSGAIKAYRVGNSFDIQTSRVGKFSIDISPSLVRFDQPVKVVVNGKECFSSVLTPDSRIMLNEFQSDRDRIRLVYTRLTLDVPME